MKISTREVNQLSNATKSAASFLLKARDAEGWWKDFYIGRNPCDEWITAYIAAALAVIPDTQASEAAIASWELLKTRSRSTGGWGFNRLIPEDADTTGWVLQLAREVGAGDSELAHNARSFIKEHVQPDGGIATYATDKAIRAYLAESVQLFFQRAREAQLSSPNSSEFVEQFKLFVVKHFQPSLEIPSFITDEMLQSCLITPSRESFHGWCQSHICVSAAIATLPEFRLSLHNYLNITQRHEGNWLCYWWIDHEYATALAAEALATGNEKKDQICVERAVAWGIRRLSPEGFVSNSMHPEGSPFATACCLRLLLLNSVNEEVKAARTAATRWLLQQQNSDGAWSSSAWLRIPHTHDIDPNQTSGWIYGGMFNGSIIVDQHQVYTTTTVMLSLQKALSLILTQE